MARRKEDELAFHAMNIVNYWDANIAPGPDNISNAVYTSITKELYANREYSSVVKSSINSVKNIKIQGSQAFNASLVVGSSQSDNKIYNNKAVSAGVEIGADNQYSTSFVGTGKFSTGSFNGFAEQVKQDIDNLTNSTKDAYNEWLKQASDQLSQYETPGKDAIPIQAYISDLLKKDAAGRERTGFDSWFEECIPCDLRIELLADLDLFGDFLSQLERDIKLRIQNLTELIRLLFSPPQVLDLCELAKFFSFMCIPDLYAVVLFLMNYINGFILLILNAKADATAALMALVEAIFSPLMLLLNNIMNGYLQLVIAPIDCIIDALREQTKKIPTGFDFDQRGITPTSLFDSKYQRIGEIRNKLESLSNTRIEFDASPDPRASFEDVRKNLFQFKERPSPNMPWVREVAYYYDDVKTGLESVYITMLLARKWTKEQIEKMQKWVEDFLAKALGENKKKLDIYRIIYEVQTIINLVLSIIALLKAKKISCNGTSDDMRNIIRELANRRTFNRDILLGQNAADLPDVLRKTGLFDDLDPNDIVILPDLDIQDVEVSGDNIEAIIDVEKFGKIKVPVTIVRSCETAVKFEQNERMKQWMEEILRTRSQIS